MIWTPRDPAASVWTPRRRAQQGFLLNPFRFGGSSSLAYSIYTALVAYWQFEEAGAGTQFNDAFGTNHLSIRNSSGPLAASSASTASGVVGRALDSKSDLSFTAYVPRSNTSLDLPNANWTFGGWINAVVGAGGSARFLMGRLGAGTSGNSYVADISLDGSTDTIRGRLWNGSGAGTFAGPGRSSGAAGWALYALTLNRAANLVEFRYRHITGAFVKETAAFASALNTAANTANFCINNGLAADGTYFSGLRSGITNADQCFYLSKAMTDAEFDYLFNAGLGRSFAQLKANAGF